MIKVVGGLLPGKSYAIQARYLHTDGSLSAWSQVFRFTTASDATAPGNVQNLTVNDLGDAHALRWNQVTVDQHGAPLTDFKHYRIAVSDGIQTAEFISVGEAFNFTKNMNFVAFGQAKSTLTFSVWAVDTSGNNSLTPAVLATTPSPPPVPSAPAVSSYSGLLMVSWDGKAAGGGAMPTNLSHCEVHISTDTGFTPSNSTYARRLDPEGSASRGVIPGLDYGVRYYAKLIAINLLGMRSDPSGQGSGVQERLTGLDIADGQISPSQINFTARDIGGANTYYPATVTERNALAGIKNGDIAYVTGSGYTPYRYNGTTWVLAPEVGVVSGTKILAGTVTADAVGTNLIISSKANIGNAVIDQANISSVNASSIRTGALQANQEIIAGNVASNHARVTSTGFYVRGPQAGGDPANPQIVDRIRMGTGVSDFFAIPDPINTDSTLAQIDENGVGSFQSLHSTNDITMGGRSINELIDETGNLVAEVTVSPIVGLAPSGASGIRGEYGIAQFSAPVVAGRTYEVTFVLNSMYQEGGFGRPFSRIRAQVDNRTQAQIDADTAPTRCTLSSQLLYTQRQINTDAPPQTVDSTILYRATTTGIVTFGLSVGLFLPDGASNVIKITESSAVQGWCKDLGPTIVESGSMDDMGGSLYQWTAPAPTKPAARTSYYKKYTASWVRGYQGNGSLASTVRAYQGTDPSGYNGNMIGYFGWAQVDFTSLLAGATVDKIMLYIYFNHWYYNSGGTARMGYHNVWSTPSAGASRTGTIAGTVDVPNWPKPGAKRLQVSSWGPAMKSGAFRGVALGPGNQGLLNYGYATNAYLEIWYTK